MSTPTALKGAPARLADHGVLVGTVFRIALGLAMLVAGGLKITDLPQSAVAVKAYRVFPQPVQAEIVGYALPPLEMLLGLLLITGLFTRVAAGITAVLLVIFIVGIISVWARDISIECGCFNAGGASDSPINPYEYAREIFRDLILLFLAVWLVRWPRTRWALDSVARPSLYLDDELALDDDDFDDDDDVDDDADDNGGPSAAGHSPRDAEEPAR